MKTWKIRILEGGEDYQCCLCDILDEESGASEAFALCGQLIW